MSQSASAPWFYALNGQQYGPVELSELQRRLAAGEVSHSDLVWRDGMANWQAAATVPELAPGAAYVPPTQAPLGYASPLGVGYLNYNTKPVIYAGFWWRVLASIIDSLVLLVPNMLINLLVELSKETGDPVTILLAALGAMVVQVAMHWLYYALMHSSGRQATLGKMACGLVVTDLNGNRISFARATARFFASILSTLTLGIGYIMAAFTQRKQALHDIICETLVIKKQ